MKELILPGLSENQGAQKMYFVMFLLLYTLTVAGNLTVLTVTSSRHLNSPMYFFICHLSFVDVCYSSTTAPQMISGSLMENNTISFAGCIGRHFGLHFFWLHRGFHLDSHGLQPLHGHLPAPVLPHRLCGFIVGVSWAGGFLHSTLQTLPTTLFPFCGPHKDAHFFYDDHPCSPWPVPTRAPRAWPTAGSYLWAASYPGHVLRGHPGFPEVAQGWRGGTRPCPRAGPTSLQWSCALGPACLFTSAHPVACPRTGARLCSTRSSHPYSTPSSTPSGNWRSREPWGNCAGGKWEVEMGRRRAVVMFPKDRRKSSRFSCNFFCDNAPKQAFQRTVACWPNPAVNRKALKVLFMMEKTLGTLAFPSCSLSMTTGPHQSLLSSCNISAYIHLKILKILSS